jgi:L-cysteine desulfidase
MKTFRICLFAAFSLMLTVQSYASEKPESTVSKTLRNRVALMVDAPNMGALGIDETSVFVNFEINEKNEIKVIEVVSDDKHLSRHVFNSLNKQKVKIAGLPTDEAFNIKIVFRTEKNA